MVTRSTRAFVIPPGSGDVIRGPVGGPTIVKARSEDTDGTFAFLENVIPSMQGPPLHVHTQEDEAWYVLEGHFRFRADDELLEAPAGSFVFVPRGTRHCFQNIGSEDARILVMFVPSGMEGFFEAHAQLPPGAVDPEAYREIAGRYGMELAGPPLGVSDPL